MAALTADRLTPRRDGKRVSLPVAASTRLYAGSLVCLNATGYATKGAISTTLKAVGVAVEAADNSGGANGAINVEVERGTWRFGNSSGGDLIALADVGSVCYVVDDQTVAKTHNTNTRSVAGTVRDVDAAGVWVEF
ncbi:MAG: hypothetical protein AMXMBFR78_33890 [Rubrivivax sp.]